MFSENPGPTALRIDLVQAMSFSAGEATIQTPNGPARALAALSGVWNGTKAYVAVLVRPLDSPNVRRFTFAHPLHSVEELWSAVEEGIAFVEGMGFSMDPPEFVSLSEDVQRGRLEAWDVLRKSSPDVRTRRLPAAKRLARPPVETGAPTGGGAVLGRVAVVRGETATRARLLAQF